MSARFGLGDRVKVAAVYEFPPETTWEMDEEAELVAVPNDRSDVVAVVVGVIRRKHRAVVSEGIGDSLFLSRQDTRKSFYAVRYSLRGRCHLTLGEHMTAAGDTSARQ